MLSFPNAKINIGLKVLEKRSDGYHNIETVFCPIGLCDILEFVVAPATFADSVQLAITGGSVTGSAKDNLCVKAYQLLKKDFQLPPLLIHLHKIIPVGAGLGGGSSDAAFMLKGLNNYFQLGISEDRLCDYASELGSDCAFFIKNRPLIGYKRGNLFKEIDFLPKELEIIVVNPGIYINTAEAYSAIVPAGSGKSLKELIKLPIKDWQQFITNEFESFVFQKYPAISRLKHQLYEHGAVYASLSGSGSSVYGLFYQAPDLEGSFEGYFHWKGSLLFEEIHHDEQ